MDFQNLGKPEQLARVDLGQGTSDSATWALFKARKEEVKEPSLEISRTLIPMIQNSLVGSSPRKSG